MSKTYIRLPNGNKTECYDYTINPSTCVVRFINANLKEVKDFFGTEIINYIDFLNSKDEVINSYDIYKKRQECIVEDTTIQEVEYRVVQEAYDEVIPAVKDEETQEIIMEEQIIHHEAIKQPIYKTIPVEMITVVMGKPSINEEIDNIKNFVGMENPNCMTVEEFKMYYKSLLGNECTKAIYEGCDVTTSLGKKHFSYTADDQNNIQDLITIIGLSEENVYLPYHADGEYCTMFEGTDIVKIFSSLSFNKMYHTTYCNILNRMVESKESINDIKSIFYGMEITNKKDKQLLESLMVQGQTIVEKVLNKIGVTITLPSNI